MSNNIQNIMTTPSKQQQSLLARVTLYVLEAIDESGQSGAPSGIIYAALMQQGATLNQFNSLMGSLINAGHLTEENHIFQMTEKGKGVLTSLQAILH